MTRIRQAGHRLVAGLLFSWLLLGSALAASPPALDPAAFRELLQGQQGQVVLVNFWASWCRPCLKEISVLQALEAEYRGEGLRLLLVALDEPEDHAGVLQPFIDKWFPGLPTYRRATADMDALVSVLDPTWNELLPTSYLLDRGGTVRARLQGGKSAEEFAAAVRPWLGAAAVGGQAAAPGR